MLIDYSLGVCICLTVLAAVFRLLVGLKSLLEKHRADLECNERYIVINERQPSIVKQTSSAFKRAAEDVIVVRRNAKRIRSWEMTVDGTRAAIDAVIICVLYLLVLSLMTMNAGYSLSVFCGIVLGNLAVKRYSGEALSRRTISFVVAMTGVIIAGDLY